MGNSVLLHNYFSITLVKYSLCRCCYNDNNRSNSFFVFRYCGHRDPTWLELQHFVHFLGDQLKKVQRNPFCHDEEALPGFKSFVVRFMISMAQVRPFIVTLCYKHIPCEVLNCLYTSSQGFLNWSLGRL